MFNRIKRLRIVAISAIGIAIAFAMQSGASADITPSGYLGSVQSLKTGTTNNYDVGNPSVPLPILVGDTVYVYGEITYNRAGIAPVESEFLLTSIPTATFTFVGVAPTIDQCRADSISGNPPTLPQTAPTPAPGLIAPVFCWTSSDFEGGDNDITLKFNGNASFATRTVTTTITVNRPTPKVVISTVTLNDEEATDPAPAPTPTPTESASPSASPTDSAPLPAPISSVTPSPTPYASSTPTATPMPNPTSTSGPSSANAFAHKGDLVQIKATVSFNGGSQAPTGHVFFYEQDPTNNKLGTAIVDKDGVTYGCDLTNADNVNVTNFCTITVNASDLHYFTSSAIGSHGLVGVYVGTHSTDILPPYVTDPALPDPVVYSYSSTVALHGGAAPEVLTDPYPYTSPVSFLDDSHFDATSGQIKFDSMSGDTTLGDKNFTGAVSAYNSSVDLFEQGNTFLINIYRGWAHVSVAQYPSEATQYGQEVLFNVQIAGNLIADATPPPPPALPVGSANTAPVVTAGSLGVRLTDPTGVTAPIYLYCDETTVTTDSFNVSNCLIATVLLHPIHYYDVDAFYMGDTEYMPTTYMGYSAGEVSLGNYLAGYFYNPEDPLLLNKDTVDTQATTAANNLAWKVFADNVCAPNAGVNGEIPTVCVTENTYAFYNFFNDPDDYPVPTIVRGIISADPAIDITTDEESTYYGEDAGFTVTIKNPYSDNPGLDAPNGTVYLTSDLGDWRLDCALVTQNNPVSTYYCSDPLLLGGAHEIYVHFDSTDDNYNSSTTVTSVGGNPTDLGYLPYTVNPFEPTITIFANPETTEYGQTVTFTVTVVGTANDGVLPPTGTVVLKSEEQSDWEAPTCVLISSTEYNPVAYSSTYTCQGSDETLISLLHTITAEFTSDDANYADGVSTDTPYTVDPTTPNMVLVSDQVTTNYGEVAKFTVELTNPNSSNTVLIYPEGDVTLTTDFPGQEDWLATCELTSSSELFVTSVYSCESPLLLAGTHTLTAHFDTTDDNYYSTETTMSYTVGAYTPEVLLSLSTDENDYGYEVTFTVTVTGTENDDVLPPVGTVTLSSSEQPDWVAPTCEQIPNADGSLSSTYTCFAASLTLLGGDHGITASFTSADDNYTDAESEASAYTVNPVLPNMTGQNPDSTHYGDNATFYVTLVHPDAVDGLVAPTGEVTLESDWQTDWLGLCVLDETVGTVTQVIYKCDSTTLLTGDHVLTATYEGDTNYATNALVLETFTVQKTDLTITITADPESTKYGEEAHFTVELTNPFSTENIESPTGDVWLTTNNDDQNASGEWQLACTLDSSSDGSSTYDCLTPSLLANVNPHTLTVHYSGDDNYTSTDESSNREIDPKALTTLDYLVEPYTPEVTITQSEESTEYGDVVTFTVTVVGTGNEGVETPVGTVVLTTSEQDGWQLSCDTAVNADGAELTTYTCSADAASLIAGNHDITATFTTEEGTYLGYNYANTTGEISHEVVRKTPAIDFTTSDPMHYGETTTFTVVLSGTGNADSSDTGSVVLAPIGGELTITSDDQQDWSSTCVLDTGVLTGSQAQYTCTTTTLLASSLFADGVHHLTASYEGDDNYTSVESTNTQQILKTDLEITITADPESTHYGEVATFTVEMTNPYSTEGLESPTGRVWLTTSNDDQNASGQWQLDCSVESDVDGASTLVCETPVLFANVDPHTLTVNYAGDDNYSSSDESLIAPTTMEYTVDAFTPEVTVTSDPESTQYGDPVTFTVTVVGTGNEGVAAPVGTVVLTSSVQENWTLTCDVVDNASDAELTTYTCAGTSGTLLGGDHTIIATFTPEEGTYLGNNYTQATGELDYEVTLQDPYMTLTASPEFTNTYGSQTTFTVTLSGTDYVDAPETGAYVLAPTGDVTLTDSESDWSIDCTPLSAQGVLGGVTYTCTGTSPLLSVGSHTITATYEGDDNYESASVEIGTYEIDRFTPTVTVDVDSTPSVYGDEQVITITIAGSGNEGVTPPTPQTITLNDPTSNWTYTGVPSCEENEDLITLVCTVETTRLFAGEYQIHATYAGDENYYDAEGTSDASVNIAKAVLDVTPAESMVSIDYGATTTPALTAKIDGFQNLEDAGSFVPGLATQFANGDNGTETTVDGTTWFLAPTCAPVNLYLENGEMVNAGTSGVYYNCSGGSAANYTFQHSGNAAISIRPTVAQLQLTSNLINTTYGQKIDLTVRLENNSGLPAETTLIDFTYGEGNYLGRCTLGDLSRNACALPTNVLPVGTNTVTATWYGQADVNFEIPKPVTILINVAQAAVVLEVTSNQNPAISSDSIVFTATLTGTVTPPTGTVTFTGTGFELVATCTAANDYQSTCVAEATTLVPDTYQVVATYSGDDNYTESVVNYVQVVKSEVGALTLVQASTASIYTNPAEFTVTIYGDPLNPEIWPTGSIVITENDHVYSGACVLERIGDSVDSACTFNVNGMEIGVHEVRASYSGDAIFGPSTAVVSHHVLMPTAVVVTSSKPTSFEGDEVTFTATVSSERGTPAAGRLYFKEVDADGNFLRLLGVCLVSGGTCSVTVTDPQILTSGAAHLIIAQYEPELSNDFITSTSEAISQQVNALLVTTFTVTQNLGTTRSGQSVDFTVNIEGNYYIPTGDVEVTIFGPVTQILTCTLANGHCTVGTDSLPNGEYTVTASYLGESSIGYAPVESITFNDALMHVVNLNATVVNVLSSKNASLEGEAVTFTANVSSEYGVPSAGSIEFFDGDTLIRSCTVAAGTCAITVSDLSVATHPITARYTPADSSIFDTARSATLDQVVNALEVTLTVTQNISTTYAGQTVDFTINAVGNAHIPTGVVNLTISSETSSDVHLSCTLANGHCTVGISTLPNGEYSVVATYAGEESIGYSSATSAAITHIVNLNATSISVLSSKNPSFEGEAVIFTALVTSERGVPNAGSVVFYDGSERIGSCQVIAGTCSITRSDLTAAGSPHAITVTFTPDVEGSIFEASSSSEPLMQEVIALEATVTVTQNISTTYAGQTVDFTVNVVGNWYIPTGKAHVTISAPGATPVVLNCTLANGHCTVGIDSLPAGTYTVTATYDGESSNGYPSATSEEITHVVVLNVTVITVASSNNPSVEGQSVTFTATVSSERGVPSTGSIEFFDGDVSLDTCQVVAGTCSITRSDLTSAGSPHSITAIFTATVGGLFADSTSASLDQIVEARRAVVTVTQNLSTTYSGQTVNFIAHVEGNDGVATGSVHIVVTHRDETGVDEDFTCTLVNGFCTFGTYTLQNGEYDVTATYIPGNYPAASTTSSILHTVNLNGTSVSIASSQNPSVDGDTVTFTSTVASERGVPSAASGSIRFFNGESIIGTCVIAGGTCSITVTAPDLTVGDGNVIHAEFVPSAGSAFDYARSADLTQVVQAVRVYVTVVSNLNTSIYGDLVKFTVNVWGNRGVATGNVNVSVIDSANQEFINLGPCLLVFGQCSVETYDLLPGRYTVVAYYEGVPLGYGPATSIDPIDSSDITSAPDALVQVVLEPTLEVIAREDATTHAEDPITHLVKDVVAPNSEDVTLRAKIQGNAGPVTGTVTFYVDGRPIGSPNAKTVCVRGGNSVAGFYADCTLVIKASVLHSYNPIVDEHYVTVSYSGGGNYPSTSWLTSAGSVPASDSKVRHTVTGLAPNHTVNYNGNSNDSRGSMTPDVHNTPTALTANAFTRAGYSFVKWNTKADGTGVDFYNDEDIYGYGADVTLYAVWTANNHTVVFNNNLGTGVIANQTTNLPAMLSANTFTRTGYTFTGWATNSDGSGDVYYNLGTYGFTADTTLYAQWSANTLTVTYNVIGGSIVAGATTVTGGTITAPNATTKPGYIFDGWFDGETRVTFPFTHGKSANFTLTAHWISADATVTFAGNGSTSGSITPQISNVPATLSANTFTRTGYTFTGWATNADGSGDSYLNVATYGFTANTTLYAQWRANSFVVIFDSASGSSVAAAITTTGGVVLTPNATTRAGYSFLGWFDGGDLITAFPYTHGKSSTFILTAQWAPAYSTVVFNANGGGTTMADQVTNLPTVLNTNTFTRTGYTFIGWTTNSNGSGDSYLNGATYSFASNITLYAQWASNILNVTFDSNGGSVVAGTTTLIGGTITAPNATTKAGFVFDGWFDGETLVTFPYTHGKIAGFTLTARWIKADTTVTFDGNGSTSGSVAPQTSNVPTGLSANAFARTGYTFAGWTTAASGTGDSYLNGAKYSFASNVTLYAQWKANTLTVTFDSNNGTPISGVSTTVTGGSVSAPAGATTLTDYVFIGWFDGDAVNPVVFPYTHGKTADFTLTAHWASAPADHTVQFNGAADNTQGSMTAQRRNVSTPLSANAFTRAGYTFVGWSLTAGGSLAYANSASYSFTSDVTLYAIWTEGPAVKHTVTYDSNTAESLGSMSPDVSNVSQPLTANSFTLFGYVFTGWNTKADGSGTAYANSATFDFLSDIKLYAQWSLDDARVVTFDGNGDDAASISTQDSTVPADLTTNGFTRAGYTFAYWTTNADGSGDIYLDSALYGFSVDVTLYAQWSANTLIVTYDAQGGSEVSAISTTTTGGILTGPAGVTTKLGYVFAGWNTKADGTGVLVIFPPAGFLHGQTSDFTLYAQWTTAEPANHTVLFNGGAADTLGSMTAQKANVSTTLSLNTFTRAGYAFGGWSLTSGGTTVAYVDGESYNFAADVTLFAIWTENPAPTFTVTFNANLGTGTMSNQSANKTTVLNANVFTRSGYTFDGWALSATGSVVYAAGVTYPFTADVTLWAHWTQNYVPYVPPSSPATPTAPVLSWSNPAAINQGTALSATQLNALVAAPSGLAGTYTYVPALGTVLAAGTQTLTVVFTPSDLVNYSVVTKAVTILVNQSAPVITSATITIGNGNGAYNGSGFAAPVSVSPSTCNYTVTYNGSILLPVNAGTYNVVVTATGNCSGTSTGILVIAKAKPVVVWSDAADITTLTALSSVQLNASANVLGRFVYTPAAKSYLPEGAQVLSALFTPTDSANYESVNVTANINVTKSGPVTITSGFALGSSKIPADQLSLITGISLIPGQVITITGYAKPSKNPAADLRLGLARANAVKAQILKKNPKAKITVKTLGAKLQPRCNDYDNKCVVIVLK